MRESPTAVEVFCSYSHQDEAWLHKLVAHLKLLEHEGLALIWHDRLLTAGTDWANEIDTRLNRAKLILLLISPSFVASDYCYSIEMQRALERHEQGEARVIPILVRPVGNWQIAPFARLQALPAGKFLVEWSEREEDIPLAQIATGIHTSLQTLLMPAVSAPRANQPSIWTVPYARNALFTGREAELAAIETAFGCGQQAAIVQPQAISGLGGIGKTQLAIEYAYRHQAVYRCVFWALADTRETLIASYSEIASLLELSEREQREQSLVIAAVKSWLTQHQSWLLILDNADSLALVRDFLPTNASGHVLLTTRAHAMGRLAERIEIAKLEAEEGCRFLLRRSGLLGKDAALETLDTIIRQDAHDIQQEVDGLPLALDQAGAYIEETGCSLSIYLDLFRSQRSELLRRRGGLVLDHPESVATTLHLSFGRLEISNEGAADLLRLCAFLAPDEIPEAFIGPTRTHLPSSLQHLADDPLQWNAALATLQASSLMMRHPNTQTLEVHRLVQVILRDSMIREEARNWAECAVQVLADLFPLPEVANWEQCQRLLPHAQVCATLIEDWRMESDEGASLLHDVGWYLRERAEYREAQRYVEQALAISRSVWGEQHPDTTASLDNLGQVYYAQGKYEQAETAHQHALAIRRAVLGEQHPDTANSLDNLGLVYRAQGKYEQAETAHQQALTIYQVVLGEQHPSTAASLNNLANVYDAQGKYEQAETAHQQALAILHSILGERHPAVATCLDNLGQVYRAQGKYEQAEAAHLQALAVKRVVLGEQHPSTANSFDNLGLVHRPQGKYEQAETAHQHALSIRHAVLGKRHPDTAASLNNLGLVYYAQRKDQEALPLFEQALAIWQDALGPEHPYTKTAQRNLEKTVQAIKQDREISETTKNMAAKKPLKMMWLFGPRRQSRRG